MFVRSKRIGGSTYAYIVKNTWTKAGPRQRVVRYLGRITELNEQEGPDFGAFCPQYRRLGAKDMLRSLVSWVLACHGFVQKGSVLVRGKVNVSLAGLTVRRGRKNAVLQIGPDYMCTYTLSRLKNFRSSGGKSEVAHALAKYFISAAIPVPKEAFVVFFSKVYRNGQSYV